MSKFCKDCAYYYGRRRHKIVYWCTLKQEQVSPYQKACENFAERIGGTPIPKNILGLVQG